MNSYLPPPDVVATALTRIVLILPAALHVLVALWFAGIVATRVVSLAVLIKTSDAEDFDTMITRVFHLLICGALWFAYIVTGFYFLWRTT